MKNSKPSAQLVIIIYTALISILIAASSSTAYAAHADIALSNYDVRYSYIHLNDWALSQSVSSNSISKGGDQSVSFNVASTKASGATTFTVHGGLTVQNIGAATATIGNIVVNLQQPNSAKLNGKTVSWVSIAADVADGTSGDSSTRANIVASGSEESQPYNEAFGAGNYAVNGEKGTFIESAGSGKLEFTDATNNTVRSLVPQITLPAGQSMTMLYTAEFDISVLPPAGTPLRVETLVTFGNAQGNGYSANADNIDINGNGRIDSDEANVLTVTSRTTMSTLPSDPDECYDQVVVSDISPDDVTTSGTVYVSNTHGFGSSTINDSTSFDVSVDFNAGKDGGQIGNTAYLDAAGSATQTLNIVVGHSADGKPIYAAYQRYPDLRMKASARFDATISSKPTLSNANITTVGQGGWGGKAGGGNPTSGGSNAGSILMEQFYQVYSNGYVEVGNPSNFSMRFTSPDAVRAYLPAKGTVNVLNADLLNPTETHSGTFGGQVLTLQLNVDFNRASVGSGGMNFCDLMIFGTGTSLDGMTVGNVLDVANNTLGGGGYPSGFTLGAFNNIMSEINNSFAGGIPSLWAQAHLTP